MAVRRGRVVPPRVLAENAELFVYHGTQRANAPGIRARGVEPRPHHPGETPVAWFGDIHAARRYEYGALAVVPMLDARLKPHHGTYYSTVPVKPVAVLTGPRLKAFYGHLGLHETVSVRDKPRWWSNR